MPKRAKQLLSTIAAIVFAAAALTYALWGIEYGRLFNLLAGGSYRALLPFVAGYTLFYWLKALRWSVILRPFGSYTWREVSPAMMIGFACNNVLPGHLGELVRTWSFARRSGLTYSSVFTSIVLERVFDLLAIFVYSLVALSMTNVDIAGLDAAAWTVALLLGFASSCLLVAALRPQWLYLVYDRTTPWIGNSLQIKGRRLLENIVHALISLQSISQLALLGGYTLSQWIIPGGLIWMSVWAYGVSISFQASLVLLAVLVLAVTVPSTPGYVGNIQAAFTFVLIPFGVDREVAVAASVFYLVAHWVPVTAAGAVLLVTGEMSYTELRGQATQAGAEADSAL